MILYVFNPEHDLCLANGNPHYMPPQTALQFAETAAHVMQDIYGTSSVALPAAMIGDFLSAHSDSVIEDIIPWGWNLTLKESLLKAGISPNALPSDETLERYRQLQNRTTIKPLQPKMWPADSIDDINEQIDRHSSIMMKAPWSGSGRGLRRVEWQLSEQDIFWAEKILREQGCVIVEPFHQVAVDFAFEYYIGNASRWPTKLTPYTFAPDVHFIGYSLFKTQNGVYRSNILWSDERIEEFLTEQYSINIGGLASQIGSWLQETLSGRYQGPVGVDLFIDNERMPYVCEMNLRHTMGLVAHERLRNNPSLEGTECEIIPPKTTQLINNQQ